MRWLIIGAGLAGLTVARTLSDHGLDVTVHEKSRGLGGRLATRRTDSGRFDHGAQYLTARGDAFRALMTGLAHKGHVAEWQPRGKDREERWHVGQPTMRDLAAPLGEAVVIRKESEVVSLARAGEQIDVIVRNGSSEETATFDGVIAAIPAPQAAHLLVPLDETFETLDHVAMAPCWAGLFAFDGTETAQSDILRQPSDVLGWISRDGSKPDRAGATFVVHATPKWSRDNLERDKDMVAEDLLAAFRRVTGFRQRSLYKAAHRWRYAFVEKPLGRPFLGTADGRIFACGDWCIAPRAEAAFDSARQLADHIKQAA